MSLSHTTPSRYELKIRTFLGQSSPVVGVNVREPPGLSPSGRLGGGLHGWSTWMVYTDGLGDYPFILSLHTYLSPVCVIGIYITKWSQMDQQSVPIFRSFEGRSLW